MEKKTDKPAMKAGDAIEVPVSGRDAPLLVAMRANATVRDAIEGKSCPKCGGPNVIVSRGHFHCCNCTNEWAQTEIDDLKDRISELERDVSTLMSENATLVKKLETSETMGEAVLENLRKMLVRYVNSGDWLCQNWQFLARVLAIVGGRSWRTDNYLRDRFY